MFTYAGSECSREGPPTALLLYVTRRHSLRLHVQAPNVA